MHTSASVSTTFLAILALLTACGRDIAGPRETTARPSFLVVLLDDQDVDGMQYMPRIQALVRDQGVSFEAAFVSQALCAPSRLSFLRGQYPHNTGVVANDFPNGGYRVVQLRGLERSTLATWLHRRNYRTALFGKYVNHYGESGGPSMPPGWTEWYATFGNGGNQGPFYNYFMNENGVVRSFGAIAADYHTRVITDRAVDFLRRNKREPFLAWYAPYAPHQPATPARRDEDLFTGMLAPRPPSFNEEDMTDKANRVPPQLQPRDIAFIDSLFRQRIRSLQAVDEGVGRLIHTLEQTGALAHTYIIVTSDNGFHLGQHRERVGKGGPWEEDMRVPLFVRGPGLASGTVVRDLVLNIDLAPTIAQLAGAKWGPGLIDGRPIPTLTVGVSATRRAVLFEGNPGRARGFRALRLPDSVYIEYESGAREAYDLRNDPYQLQNILPALPKSTIRGYSRRLGKMGLCAGAGCLALEDQP